MKAVSAEFKRPEMLKKGDPTRGELGRVPPRPRPATVTPEEENDIKAVRCRFPLTLFLGLNFQVTHSQKDNVCYAARVMISS